MRYEVGHTLDRRYTLKRVIARSEASALFEASHVHLERIVSARILDSAAAESERERSDFLREARSLDRARHPGVLEVLDVAETAEGDPYFVTEALVGRPLDGVLTVRGALPVDEAVGVILSIGDALANAHGLGITHRGLCSSSVLLVYPPFGTPPSLRSGAYARPRRPGPPEAAQLLDLGVSPSPTSRVAGPLGAMGYAAPERLAGGGADPASDAYALGALLFETLTGELPGTGSFDTVSPPVPESVRAVVRRALASREERFETAATLVAALREATSAAAMPTSAPPPKRRAHARAGYVTPVRVRRPNGQALDGRSEDVSEGGLLVIVDDDVAADESVLVRFALPISGRIVSVPAQVRWVRSSRRTARAVGLKFVVPGEKVESEIRAYVAFLGQEP